MRIKKIFILLFLMILSLKLSSQIYNPQKEINTKIRVILVYESSLYNQKDFVTIKGINLTDKKIYTLEIAPRWFLKEKFFNIISPGEIIDIIGAKSIEKKNWILVRKISFKSKNISLRTKKGFPLWRVPIKK